MNSDKPLGHDPIDLPQLMYVIDARPQDPDYKAWSDALHNLGTDFHAAGELFSVPDGVKVHRLARPALKFKRMHPDAVLPKYETAGAAAFDLVAVSRDSFDQERDRETMYRTGWAVEVPEGFVMLIFSRSGHGFKHATRLSNCVGVIDSDYRGELCVKHTYDGPLYPHFATRFNPGDRVAQAMLVRVDQWQPIEVDELSSTVRGANGFGSTGA